MFSFKIYIFVLLILILFAYAEKICPSYGNVGFEERKTCFDQCLPDNDKCESNTKCCFVLTHPCGYRCIIPKNNKSKFGKCPSPNSNQINVLWSMCDIRLCDVDNDCPDNEKCCSNICNARMCVIPKQPKKKMRFFT